MHLPGDASRLHVVGQRYVVGPDVVLPLPQAEDAAEDPPGVEADPHIELNLGGLHHRPEHKLV